MLGALFAMNYIANRLLIPNRRQALRVDQPVAPIQRGDLRHLVIAECQLLGLEVAFKVGALGG